MVSASNIDMLSTNDGARGFNCNLEDSLQSELKLLLRVQRNQQSLDREKELNIFRSGSAPPTVEASLSAVGGLLEKSVSRDGIHNRIGYSNCEIAGDDDIRSHPAYLSYYYSHDNVNPRLPPPLLSREDWKVAQRFQVGASSLAGIEDSKNNVLPGHGNDLSLFSYQPKGPNFPVQDAENDLMELRKMNRQASAEWLGQGSIQLNGSSTSGLGTRRKSFADILQEGLDQPCSLGQLRRSQSHAIFDTMNTITSDALLMGLCNEVESVEGPRSGAISPGLAKIPGCGTSFPHSFASVSASLSRNMTSELLVAGRPPSTGLPAIDGRVFPSEMKHVVDTKFSNCHSLTPDGVEDIAASFSDLSLSRNKHAGQDGFLQVQHHMVPDSHHDFSVMMPKNHNQNFRQPHFDNFGANKVSGFDRSVDVAGKNEYVTGLSSRTGTIGQVNFPKRTSSSANFFTRRNSSGFESLEGSNDRYHQGANFQDADFSHLASGCYPVNRGLDSDFNSYLGAGSGLGVKKTGDILHGVGNEAGGEFYPPIADPLLVQFLQTNIDPALQAPVVRTDLSQKRKSFGSSPNLDQLQKVYLESLLAEHKQLYDMPHLGKSSAALNHKHRRDASYEAHLSYAGNTTANCRLPSVGYASHMLPDEQIVRFTSMVRNSMGEPIGSCSASSGANLEGKLVSSLLDEFKSNKLRSFELSDIFGHVVEFSSDQYGSRFIQQKLETASEEEKNKMFPEIIPHARSLMTDVFGNYVIQKFLEHGTEIQRKELASQLIGHVLPLSLQMYGCRVIQKALEVVDLDQQTQMVKELEGSIMKCVRDQNGNHVIQKCIECVPQDRIQFIISAFYGQVVALSMHPYGCRVIQRVLEHCDDPITQQTVMDEIMQSVYSLAQDQYGNYVIQHVLEHGKPNERSAIISKLIGQVVKMSQQKFASNVVEKCLTFGSPEERRLLINEMLGSTDENEPLQVMMRDPFGNYVVQKVLETCDDHSLGFILSRVRVHLNTLKRYTYGKHIVSRVEKLIATGERRIGMTSSLS